MNKIKLNTTEFELESYNKNTYFGGESMNSNANCGIIVTSMNTLNALAEETITLLQIYHDNNLIYDLQNINAKIDSINEYLVDDHVNISINITF